LAGPKQLVCPALLVVLSGLGSIVLTLSGCATFATFHKCGLTGCPADAAITADVTAQFARYPPLTVNSVRIQTLDRVVYLTGLVDTDVERLLAVSIASDVSGVTRVVDSISVNNVGR
jgi:osmotically-inducible protein OsmY